MEAREANRNLLVEILVLWLYLLGLVFVIAGVMTAGLVFQMSFGENNTVLAEHYVLAFGILFTSSIPAMVVPCVGLGLKLIFVKKEPRIDGEGRFG